MNHRTIFVDHGLVCGLRGLNDCHCSCMLCEAAYSRKMTFLALIQVLYTDVLVLSHEYRWECSFIDDAGGVETRSTLCHTARISS